MPTTDLPPTPASAQQELETLIRNRALLIVIETRDEPRVLELLNRNGVLSFEPSSRSFVDLGDMSRLKH